jgi:hypothetical protein
MSTVIADEIRCHVFRAFFFLFSLSFFSLSRLCSICKLVPFPKHSLGRSLLQFRRGKRIPFLLMSLLQVSLSITRIRCLSIFFFLLFPLLTSPFSDGVLMDIAIPSKELICRVCVSFGITCFRLLESLHLYYLPLSLSLSLYIYMYI